MQAYYYDNSLPPYRYRVGQRQTTGGALSYTKTFYDGLGHLIQSKRQTEPEATPSKQGRNSVVDTAYDAFGQVTAASQPRYVFETHSSYDRCSECRGLRTAFTNSA